MVCFGYANGQEVTGQVIDSLTQEPLIGANVFSSSTNGTVTNIEGKFSLQLNGQEKEITVSFLGYRTKKIATNQEGLTIKLSPKTNSLNTVVVTASKRREVVEKVPVSMEVLKTGLIETKNTYNLETAIEQVPSVTVLDGQANIRGGSGYSYGAGTRVMLLLDDMPLLAGDANDVKWNYLPVENLEQVEVLKGASSALFGSSALNGVINIRTAKPKAKPETKLSIFHGIYNDPVRPDTLGERRDSAGNLNKPLKWWQGANPSFTGFSFSHLQKVKSLDVGFQLNGFNDQGYKQGETEQRLRANFQLGYNLNNKWRFELNGGGMRVNGGLFFLWESDSTALLPQGGTDTSTTTLNYYTNYRFHLDPKVSFYANNGDVHQFRSRFFYTDNQNITQPSATSESFFAEYLYQHDFSEKTQLSVGLMANKVNVFSVLYGDHDALNIAPYFQVEQKWEKLNISFGARAEYFRIDSVETQTDWLLPRGLRITEDNTTWADTTVVARNQKFKPVMRLGLNYNVWKGTFLRGSFGQGYRFPSIAEKFVATNISLLRVFPNPNLQPETGWNAEVGVKQVIKISNWKGFLDIAYYWTEYQNMMEFTFGLFLPDSITTPTLPQLLDNIGFKSLNIGRARINGWDLSLGGEGEIGPIKTTIIAGYTFMNPVNLGFDSAYQAGFSDTSLTPILKYRFRHLAKADVMLEYQKFMVGFSVRYNSFMENIDRTFEEPLIAGLEFTRVLPGLQEYRQRFNKGDYVLDMRFGYSVNDNSKVTLVVNNLLNREVMGRPGDIQPPRNIAVQYALKF
jgi:outer membrane receptor protein involved in Fe transport